MTDTLRALPFAAAGTDGVSGKRELHNDTRRYFDAVNRARFGVCASVADAFQDAEVAAAIEAATGAGLAGSYVRLEYAPTSMASGSNRTPISASSASPC